MEGELRSIPRLRPVFQEMLPYAQSPIRDRRIVFSELGNATSEAVKYMMPSVVSLGAITHPITENGVIEDAGVIGSGFVIAQNGHTVTIATNRHVVKPFQGGEKYGISLFVQAGNRSQGEGKDRRFTPRIKYVSEKHDLAFVEIDLKEHPDIQLSPAALGSSKEMKQGQTVMTIGAPYSFENTSAIGTVSQSGLTELCEKIKEDCDDYRNIDASVRPGNSGGMVFDPSGDPRPTVVGMVTLGVIGDSSTGYMLPVEVIKREYVKITPIDIEEPQVSY